MTRDEIADMKPLIYENVYLVAGQGHIYIVPSSTKPSLGDHVLIDKVPSIVTGLQLFSKLMHPPVPGKWVGVIARPLDKGE